MQRYKGGEKMRKSIIVGLFIGVLAVMPCFAVAYSENMTLTIGLQQQQASGLGQSATAAYYGVGIEIPAGGANALLANLTTGTNYGITSTTYSFAYRIELKK